MYRLCPRACLLLALAAASARAYAGPLPPQQEALVLLKVLSYDQDLGRTKGALRFAVLYSPGDNASLEAARSVYAALAALKRVTVQGRYIEAYLVPFHDEADLRRRLVASGINSLYFAPGLPDLGPALRFSQSARLNTMTGVKRYVDVGVTIGAFAEGGRPQILINLAAAQIHGHRFSSLLFKVARALRKGPP